MKDDRFAAAKAFFKKHGVRVLVAVVLLGLAVASAGAMGGVLGDLRRELMEQPPEQEQRQQAQLPERTDPAEQQDRPSQPDDPERAELPSDDLEPQGLEDAPMVGEVSGTGEVTDQQVFSRDGLLPAYSSPIEGASVLAGFSDGQLQRSETMGDWRTHNGVDLAAPEGTPVAAVYSGEVAYVMQEDLYGLVVEIDLDTGVTARYCGLAGTAEGIVVGARVSAGQQIGLSGKGPVVEAAMDPHLHLEFISFGGYIDPVSLIG